MRNLEEFKIPRWEEIPDIPLHLDQVIHIIDSWLGDFLYTPKKNLITKTMINNYVKLGFIPAPVNKKYDRVTVASLFVIAVLKSVFPIDAVSKMIGLAIDFHEENVGTAYNQFCQLLEEAVSHAVNGTSMEKHQNPEDPRDLYWNICNAFACQLYVQHIYLYNYEN